MNKKIIAAAIAASVAAPAAMADVTVYGKVRQSVDFMDTAAADNVQINDRASRLGFKGSEDLGNGLKAIYKMEFGVDISVGDTGVNGGTGDSVFTGRNAFVGLAGDFGTLVVGRHDTPLKMSTGSLDLFGDTIADNNSNQAEGLDDVRADGTIAYITPTFSGIHAAVALVPGETNANDGIAEAWSAAVIYKNNGLHLSIASEQGEAGGPLGDLDQTRFGAGYTMDAFKVAFVYENDDVAGGAEWDRWTLGGSYTMGNNVIKLKYFEQENDNAANSESDGWALGLEHNFSKRTQAQVIYIDTDVEASGAGSDGDAFSIQLNHNF